MTASDFDPEMFMQQTVDQPLETEFKLCPEGQYPASCDDFTGDAFSYIEFEYKKGPRAGQPGSMLVFELPWVIDNENAKKTLNRDRVVVTQRLNLDRDNNGALDWGTNKNVPLGQVRAAVGQNNPGPWQIMNLRGAGPAMVEVKHVEYERKDKTKGKRAEITRVVRMT